VRRKAAGAKQQARHWLLAGTTAEVEAGHQCCWSSRTSRCLLWDTSCWARTLAKVLSTVKPEGTRRDFGHLGSKIVPTAKCGSHKFSAQCALCKISIGKYKDMSSLSVSSLARMLTPREPENATEPGKELAK